MEAIICMTKLLLPLNVSPVKLIQSNSWYIWSCFLIQQHFYITLCTSRYLLPNICTRSQYVDRIILFIYLCCLRWFVFSVDDYCHFQQFFQLFHDSPVYWMRKAWAAMINWPIKHIHVLLKKQNEEKQVKASGHNW